MQNLFLFLFSFGSNSIHTSICVSVCVLIYVKYFVPDVSYTKIKLVIPSKKCKFIYLLIKWNPPSHIYQSPSVIFYSLLLKTSLLGVLPQPLFIDKDSMAMKVGCLDELFPNTLGCYETIFALYSIHLIWFQCFILTFGSTYANY